MTRRLLVNTLKISSKSDSLFKILPLRAQQMDMTSIKLRIYCCFLDFKGDAFVHVWYRHGGRAPHPPLSGRHSRVISSFLVSKCKICSNLRTYIKYMHDSQDPLRIYSYSDYNGCKSKLKGPKFLKGSLKFIRIFVNCPCRK